MTDAFSGAADAVHAPATRALAVVPSDTVALADLPKALWIGSGGSVALRGAADQADTVFIAASGTLLPFRARWVRASGTSAADIVALY